MTDLNQPLAHHAATYPAEAIGAELAANLSRNLTDGLAAIIGGWNAPGVDDAARLLIESARPANSHLFVRGGALAAPFAAQINATAGHALDFDDTLDAGGGMHAGALVHSAALAVADDLGGVDGQTYLSAVAVGLDIAVRLALAPTQDFGWHRTSAFGIFGVVGAVGRLLKLNPVQFEHAFGIATSLAGGNRQCIADGALSKRLQAGFAARDGILAVQLALHGLTGARRAFEGKDGFFNLYQRGAYDRTAVTDGLGEVLLADRISLKPYPCGRNLHALIDAVLRARSRHDGRAIARIEAGAHAASSVWPTHVVEAQFSVPFVVALATVTGAADLAHFADPQGVDPAIRALGDKVELIENGPPSLVIHYEDGSSHRETIEPVATGHPSRPIPLGAVQDKLRAAHRFAGSPLPEAQIAALIDHASDLTVLDSTSRLTRALSPAS